MKSFDSLAGAVASIALALLCACGSSDNSGGNGGGGGSASAGVGAGGTADRGEYLVKDLLYCGQCHTPSKADGTPDDSLFLAGSRSYDFTTDTGEVVSVYAENITSDVVQGVGEWTDEMVRTAITRGTDDVNVAMWPIMPYPEYSLLSEDDLNSILKFLRTVPASKNVVAPDTLADPFPPAMPVQDSQIPPTTLAQSDADYDSAQRGRYLASVGCVNCHTPEITPGNPDFKHAFAGGRTYTSRSDVMPSTSTNLTPDATGLQGWTVDDIVTTMKTNTEKGTNRKLCSTAPHQMANLTDGDLTDIATYLHSLAPVKNGPFTCN